MKLFTYQMFVFALFLCVCNALTGTGAFAGTGEVSVSLRGSELTMPAHFGPRMIVQRDRVIPVWGTAAPKESVTVVFAGQTCSVKADDQGRWRADLRPIPAGGPYLMTVSGKSKKLVFSDVLVGDVWICSGQSNMAFVLKDVQNAKTELAVSKHSNIRLLRVSPLSAADPVETVKTRGWMECVPASSTLFSAVAYYFGAALDSRLNPGGARNVPIGLIDNSWGGATCEAYIEAGLLKKNDRLIYLFDSKRIAGLPPQKRPSVLYNGMLRPLAPSGIKGVVWYQGEANAPQNRAPEYADLFPLLIKNWRKLWGQGDFPFYFVQLPNFRQPQKAPNEPSEWALLRRSQAAALSLTHTEQAVTIDLGDPNDIHPKNKKEVGKRLAAIALALDYGVSGEYTGPRPLLMSIDGKQAVLHFEHCGSGLVSKGEKLTGFAMAGSDGIFHWADAVIQNKNCIILSSAKVDRPVVIRYAWADNPIGNLCNREGFPAGTFEIREH